MVNKKAIKNTVEEILDKWFGPNGKCWCEQKQKYVDVDSCNCPDCKSISTQDLKQYRYLHLRDDGRTY